MFTFRSSLTFAVMAFIVALAVLLIAIQVLALRWATHEAASAHMDASSARALELDASGRPFLPRVERSTSSSAMR